MRIEAKNLQDALLVAAAELECSVLDLEYEVVQHHKNGILGLFQKNSIIEARCKRRKGDKKFGKKRDFEGRYSNPRYSDRYEDGRDFEGRNQRENSRFEGRFESGSSTERSGKFESTSNSERSGKFSKGYDSFTDKAFYDDFSSEDKKSKSFENTYSKPFESKKPHQSEQSYESTAKKSEPKPYSISTNQPKSKTNSSQNSSGVASNLSQNDTRNSNVSSNLTQNQVAENANSSQNSAVEGLNSAQELNLAQNSNQNSAQSSAAQGDSASQTPKPSVSTIQKSKYVVRDDDIFNSFHKESVPNPKLYIDEIRIQLDKLLKAGEFGVRISELSVYDKDSIYIKLEGEDAALLIGKEAYRYKALSYLLHNWINSRYKLLIRLEIADFLRNQSQSMDFYLQSIIERVEATGKAQTKPLDGVLVKLALEKLRERFPNKYVGIKQNGEEKIVIINDFLKKNE